MTVTVVAAVAAGASPALASDVAAAVAAAVSAALVLMSLKQALSAKKIKNCQKFTKIAARAKAAQEPSLRPKPLLRQNLGQSCSSCQSKTAEDEAAAENKEAEAKIKVSSKVA